VSGSSRKQANLLKDLPECIDESLSILDNMRCKKIVVCFSGGKDSIVTESMCKLAGLEYDLIYGVTTIDPPEIVKFIHKNYPQTIFDKPKMSFYKHCEENFSPCMHRRWCCSVLKEKKYPEYDYKIMGIRAEESKKRSGRKVIDEKRKSCYPIYFWSEWHVWEYILTHDLPYPSLYDEGWDRIGCVLCFFHSYKEHLRSMKRWPHMYRKFKEAIAVWAKNNDKTWTADEWLDQYIKKKGMVDL
jgi:phosphoadenosine phosphosulfate reductase